MAKKRKHSKKRNKRKHSIVNNTTERKQNAGQGVSLEKAKAKPAEPKREAITDKAANQSPKNLAELADVRFSLILLAVITLTFAFLYFLLRNQQFSDHMYGLIKLTN